MIRPPTNLQIRVTSSFNRLAATVLNIGILQSSMSAGAQVPNVRLLITNQASYTYTDPASHFQFPGSTRQLQVIPSSLTDPLGRILGCSGELLPDYTGFSVAIYEPDPKDPTGTELGRLTPLTRTDTSSGKAPNIENSNPFFLSNLDGINKGVYNFLLDPNIGQTDPGKIYILVINPPPNSIYKQRRVKLQILNSTGAVNNNIVRYTATSLDGQPITTTGENSTKGTIVLIPNAELVGLNLFSFQFTTNLCQPNQVQIIKSGDRAAAEPGDTVIYRLSIKNLTDTGLKGIVVTDDLPLGFNFLSKSVRGEVDGKQVTITSQTNGSTLTFRTDFVIPRLKELNIVYAAQLTPDSIRGSGRNIASVNVQRVDNSFRAKDGPATYQLQIRPGIVADCGTIVGRVFVDKNFDGEQQSDEPGVPNAVIYLEDGNRITTDANGLFSVINEPPGNHTGVLDLSSVPGYTLAPNHRFKERNSQSRLVRLEPGGLVRMNFAVTPSIQEKPSK